MLEITAIRSTQQRPVNMDKQDFNQVSLTTCLVAGLAQTLISAIQINKISGSYDDVATRTDSYLGDRNCTLTFSQGNEMQETLSDSQLQNALFGAITAGCAFSLIITASNDTNDVINVSNKKNIQSTIAAILVALSVAHTTINHRNISEKDSDSSANNLMWTILYDVYDSCKPDIPLVEIRSYYLSGLSKECNQFYLTWKTIVYKCNKKKESIK